MSQSIRSSHPRLGAARMTGTSIPFRSARSGTRSAQNVHSCVFPERSLGFPPQRCEGQTHAEASDSTVTPPELPLRSLQASSGLALSSGVSPEAETDADSATAFLFGSESHPVPDHRVGENDKFPRHRDGDGIEGFSGVRQPLREDRQNRVPFDGSHRHLAGTVRKQFLPQEMRR